MKTNPKHRTELPTAKEYVCALAEHIHNLRPSINPKPKRRQMTATAMTARAVNSSMAVVRTSLQVARATDTKTDCGFMLL